QTPGELRTRTERMYSFETLESVHSALNLLMKREPPLVAVLPRQPGTKESRYTHLLTGAPAEGSSAPGSAVGPQHAATVLAHSVESDDSSRVAHLVADIASLRQELADLRAQFAAFQKQFQ